MAALIRHGFLTSPLKSISRLLLLVDTSRSSSTTTTTTTTTTTKSTTTTTTTSTTTSSSGSGSGNSTRSDSARPLSDEPPLRETVHTLYSAHESLATRGFLRAFKPYTPPKDASKRLNEICKKQQIPVEDDTVIEDPQQRFQLFVACEKEFKYSLPNSLLCHIETIGDLRGFYSTPVSTTTPLDNMRNLDLPKNLHIQYEYHRFHPDTDTMFSGKTAFPESSTLVTGLKYKKKYPGHRQKDPYLELALKHS